MNYTIQSLDFSNLEEIEGAWKTDDFTALLDAMEYGDIAGLSDEDLRAMCFMSLQDQEPDEAAYLVLKHVIGNDLRDGQLRNMPTEMPDEKLWEEYVDPAFHERLFQVGSLLFAAMPQTFPKADAVKVSFEVTASDAASAELLTSSPDESFVVRLLADGMDDHAVLHRMYGEQLKGSSFPNAAEIVWIITASEVSKNVWQLEVISSGYWLDALERTKSYESNAFADEISEPED